MKKINLVVLSVLVGTVLSAFPQTQPYDPNNPALGYTVWGDDEIGIFTNGQISGNNPSSIYWAEAASDLASLTRHGIPDQAAIATSTEGPTDAVWPVTGRFWRIDSAQFPGADRPVYVYRSKLNASMLHVTMAGTELPLIAGQTAGTLASNLAPRITNATDFIAVAAGDLDRKPNDTDYTYRDKVVVAYATASADKHFPVQVAVIDCTQCANSGPSDLRPTVTTAGTSATLDGADILSGSGPVYGPAYPVDNALGVAVGDFDGDGVAEIAVAYLSSSIVLTVESFRYHTDDAGIHTLTRTGRVDTLPLGWTASNFDASLDVTAGDFDGNGRDELAVGYSAGNAYAFPQVWVATFRFTAALAPSLASGFLADYRASYNQPYVPVATNAFRVRVASGLFRYDPAGSTGEVYGLQRRQLAVASASINAAYPALVQYFVLDKNLQPADFSNPRTFDAFTYGAGYSSGLNNLWLVAGGFKGSRNSTQPYSSLALATSSYNPSTNELSYYVHLLESEGSGFAPLLTTKKEWQEPGMGGTTRGYYVPIFRYDFDDDTVYLGAPAHYVLKQVLSTDFILYEPPKHAYWDPTETNPDGSKGVLHNVSRQESFNLVFTDQNDTAVTTDYHDTSDNSWGLSETVTAGLAVGGNPSILRPKPPAFELSMSEHFGYDYDMKKDDYNTNQTRRTEALTVSTTADDAIQVRYQDIDVYRYRMFGSIYQDPTLNQPLPGFFDITIPRPVIEKSINNGTNVVDWYQPVHENGNILSYPEPSNGTYLPPDMGSYKIPCTAFPPATPPCDADPSGRPLSTQTVNGPLLSAYGFPWGGNDYTYTWTDSNTVTQGQKRTMTNTLNENVDIKSTQRFQFLGAKVSLTEDVEAHGKQSWGYDNKMESQTSQLSSIKLHIPTGSGNDYAVYPVLYATTEGTLKAAFAAEVPLIPAGNLWTRLYGSRPDPALNLPLRFVKDQDKSTAVNTVYMPNILETRKQIRGFFVRQSTPDPVTEDYVEVGTSPVAGQTYRLETRVYNYSVGEGLGILYGTQPLDVRFDVVEISPMSGDECPSTGVWPPDSSLTGPCVARNTIGATQVGTLASGLAPRAWTTAWINWTIPAEYGQPTEANSRTYRIYVVLDPDKTIENASPGVTYPAESGADPDTGDDSTDYGNRTYCKGPSMATNNVRICINPGQNKEGWRQYTVLPDVATGSGWDKPGKLSFQRDALAARNPRGKLVTHNSQTYLGEPLQIRVRIDTDKTYMESNHVLLWDGEPNAGGTLISEKEAFTGNPMGNYIWFDWLATRPLRSAQAVCAGAGQRREWRPGRRHLGQPEGGGDPATPRTQRETLSATSQCEAGPSNERPASV